MKTLKRLAPVIVASVAVAAVVAGPAFGSPADLDPTFGNQGIATVSSSPVASNSGVEIPEASAVAVASNGDVVVVGTTTSVEGTDSVQVARFTNAGAPDTTFGTGGVTSIPLSGLAIASSVAIESDGDVVLPVTSVDFNAPAGNGPLSAAVYRLTPSGQLDSSFGQDGKAAVEPSATVEATGVTTDASGNVLVTGEASSSPTSTGAPFVERITPSGTADQTFGTAGLASLSTVGGAEAVAVDPSGNIDLAGASKDAGLTVWQLSSTGALNTSFGTSGSATLPLPDLTGATGILPESDGSMVVVGDFATHAIVAKLTSTGSLDTTFGDNGLLGVDVPGEENLITGGALTSGGGILIGGAVDPAGLLALITGQGGGLWTARLNPDGTPDLTFAPDGVASEPISGGGLDFSASAGPAISGGTQPVFAGEAESSESSLLPGETPTTTPSSPTASSTPTAASTGPELAAIRLQGGAGTANSQITEVDRLSGPDRITTAIAVSQATFAAGGGDNEASPLPTAGGVVLVSANDYADALVGTPLAASLTAPLLLTGSTTLDPRVATEISRVLGDPSEGGEVTVLGGSAALPDQIIGQIADLGYTVRRIGGTDRFDTSVQVAQAISGDQDGLGALLSESSRTIAALRLEAAGRGRDATLVLATGRLPKPQFSAAAASVEPSDADLLSSPIVLEATGDDYADATAAGAAAAHIGGVVLLTNGSTEPSEVQQYLSSTDAIAFAIGEPAAQADPTATPIVGQDRYDTAAKVASEFFVTPSGVTIATGGGYADALAGGSRAAELDEPVLLTAAATLPTTTATYLQGLSRWLNSVDLIGGSVAISNTVETAIQSAITQPAPPAPSS
jgi:uncharacterized delta-60 repeat protein